MDRLKARPSLAHLSDRFNTAPPSGYVPGRGRGVAGFSKPDPADLPKGRGAGSSAAAPAVVEGPQAAPPEDEHKLKLGTDGKLEGDAGDSRELDLSETERFEKQQLSMDSQEAGGTMEAFNMDAERREGHFDDDFNYVWKRKSELVDDATDAWLGEVDAASETAEKVEKRRRLLQQQIETQQQPREPEADRVALMRRMVSLMEPEETVARAIRRLSSLQSEAGLAAKRQGKQKAQPDAAAPEAGSSGPELRVVQVAKVRFEQLTEAADTLLRAGNYDIYSARRETLEEQVTALGGGVTANGEGDMDGEAAAREATALGIDEQVHTGAVGGGFVLDAAHRVYYNASNGLYFDPSSLLYWPASTGGTVG